MRRLVISVVALLAAGQLSAQQPLKSVDDGVLDHIELFVATLDQPRQLTVCVRPFDASTADLGTGSKDGKAARQEEARTMQEEGPKVLADRLVAALQKEALFKDEHVLNPGDTVPANAVVIEGKFVTLDPGSRAKRYFAGFGAGKSAVKVSGTVKDASGRTLAAFSQRRVGTMGMGGGDSLGKLMSDSRRIGEDIASFLVSWARGDDLKG